MLVHLSVFYLLPKSIKEIHSWHFHCYRLASFNHLGMLKHFDFGLGQVYFQHLSGWFISTNYLQCFSVLMDQCTLHSRMESNGLVQVQFEVHHFYFSWRNKPNVVQYIYFILCLCFNISHPSLNPNHTAFLDLSTLTWRLECTFTWVGLHFTTEFIDEVNLKAILYYSAIPLTKKEI